jgi:hypothetical protein
VVAGISFPFRELAARRLLRLRRGLGWLLRHDYVHARARPIHHLSDRLLEGSPYAP